MFILTHYVVADHKLDYSWENECLRVCERKSPVILWGTFFTKIDYFHLGKIKRSGEKKSVKRGKPENSIELGKSKKVKFNFSIYLGAFVQKHSFKMSFRCKQSVVFGEMNFHTR